MKKPPTNKKTAAQDLRTPKYLYRELSRRFGPFHADLAASHDNHLCKTYYTEDNSALQDELGWEGSCFCNPPYNNILPWVAKAIRCVFHESAWDCERVTMLLPARVGTEWWRWAEMYGRIHRIEGRVRFEDENGVPKSNPFEYSVVVVFERDLNMRALLNADSNKNAGSNSDDDTDNAGSE